jgi:hypothetical protein
MKENTLIGSKFQTPSGGELTVVNDNGLKGKAKRYICTCSVCSKDEELFPYGSIITHRYTLISGGCPCGCSKKVNWKEWQNKIRVQRECEKRDYIFHGWHGKYKGNNTYLDLEMMVTGVRWDTTSLSSLIKGVGNIQEGWVKTGKALRKTDRDMIKCFMNTGKFLDGTKFWRSENTDHKGHKTRWNYICPNCSNDEYVQAGLCSGIFENSGYHLKQGQRSCRCHNRYIWTLEQRDYQINKICNDENLTFLGLISEDEVYKVVWLCLQGHRNITTITNFIAGKRCRVCRDLTSSTNGYYSSRKDEKDYLYIINFYGKYLKVGRSFDIDRRLKELAIASNINSRLITVISVLTSTHQEVYDTEQWLHEELTERGFEYNKPDGVWSTELFTIDSLSALKYLLKDTDLTMYKG